ncbi:MAG TPA: hypothetical protein VLG92_01215 [Candidatus Saccharimonadia bacterium]|nr:hypothetical protein [Candidatus Saccharimonadia bacterium]
MADTDNPKDAKKRESLPSKSDGISESDKTPNQIDIDDEGRVAEAEPDDTKTEAAVDDIIKSDADTALKVQDEAGEHAVVMKQSFGERFKHKWVRWWSTPRKRNGTIAAVLLALVVLGAVPFTRYNIAGLIMKSSVTVSVVDSKTGAPVSGAQIKLGGVLAETDAKGKVTLKVHAGSKTLEVSKSYYKSASQNELIKLSSNKLRITVVALGRQVKVKVTNKITGKPVTNATITIQGAKTKTDANGLATVVLASSATVQSATIGGDNFNTTNISITATGDLAKNTFSITPSGKLYFLSNLSGKIDVVKTNLDGSERQTVLAGTGSEDRYTTSLLASRDWKYLALLSKRSGDNASIYLIDTTNGDKLTTVDQGDAVFTLVGWSGDRFIYRVDRNSVQNWQPNAQALKSFDPATSKTLLLDQTQGGGTDQHNYARQQIGSVYLLGDQVVYAKTWYGYGNNVLAGKSSELDSIGGDGSSGKTLKTFTTSIPSGFGYVSLGFATVLYEPSGIYLSFAHDNTTDFYDYEDGKVTADTSMTEQKFEAVDYGTTFLVSPSGNSTFWGEQRDGKTTLFVGDNDGKNEKQIASLSDYNTYGWFTDNYLLVSKSSSELYIMPASGGTPVKITDYYKPAINYQGYGGGYGGL